MLMNLVAAVCVGGFLMLAVFMKYVINTPEV